MSDLRIIGWEDFDCEYPTRKFTGDELNEVLNLIRREIAENNYVFSGEEHQNCLTGVPVFSDGTCFRASMRAWGQVMASVYRGADGAELSYMDFYMSLGDKSVMPEYEIIDVEPAVLEEESIGCTTKEDRGVVNQSIAFNMFFMTTDKVLKKLYKKIKGEN